MSKNFRFTMSHMTTCNVKSNKSIESQHPPLQLGNRRQTDNVGNNMVSIQNILYIILYFSKVNLHKHDVLVPKNGHGKKGQRLDNLRESATETERISKLKTLSSMIYREFPVQNKSFYLCNSKVFSRSSEPYAKVVFFSQCTEKNYWLISSNMKWR